MFTFAHVLLMSDLRVHFGNANKQVQVQVNTRNVEEKVNALKRCMCVFVHVCGALQPADVPKPMSAPGPVLKANSLSNLEQERATYRCVVVIETPGQCEAKSAGFFIYSCKSST